MTSTAPGVAAHDPTPVAAWPLLDAAAAASCPVKTQYRFTPGAARPDDRRLQPTGADRAAGGSGAGRADDPRRVRAEIERDRVAVLLVSMIEQAEDRLVDLRPLGRGDPDAHRTATARAVADGVPVVLGPALPPDQTRHRTGAPDLLVRGADTARGAVYHPVAVRARTVIETVGPGREDPEPADLCFTTLTRPRPIEVERRPGATVRLSRHQRDLRELAHHHRLLEAAGWAADRAWAGLLGPGPDDGPPVLVWIDLDEPTLQRYDQAFARRLDVAQAAVRQEPPLLEPVVVRECQTCPWWQHCRDRLNPDDVSVRIDRGALDRREVERLRVLGFGTVAALAEADLDELLPSYLPFVAHRSRPEDRLRTAQRRARMLRRGVDFARESTDPIKVPRAGVEVDLDLESAADGRTYLWGFWVERPAQPDSGRYISFGRFADLDDEAESALAVQALTWLRALVETEPSVAVYHYSAYEVERIQALAAREEHPTLRWAAGYAADRFVDLLPVVQQHYFGVHGLGLKLIAGYAGFGWRDQDPGGLNSQQWFADAAHGRDHQIRAAARQRVLDYNEDDVRATRHLRRWLVSR